MVVIWLFARRLSARAKVMRRERERLESLVAGQREMAGAQTEDDQAGGDGALASAACP